MNVLTRLHQAPSPALRLLVAGLLLVLAFAGGYAVAADKTVTLSVDGTAMTVTTMKSRVIDVITENGFTVSERDDLYPAAGDRVRDATNIVLRRSRPLEIPLAGMALPVVSAKTVEVDDAGVVRNVRLAAARVGELLAGAGAPLLQSDQVTPGAAAPVIDGMHIQVTRNRIEKVTERVPLVPPRRRIEDPEMNMSREVVEDPGTPGTQDVTFSVSKVNGVETGRLPVASHVITPAREAVVRVGTKPGTDVPRSTTETSGTPFRAARPAETGRSTPETATTAASSSTSTPGSATVVYGSPPGPTWRPGKSRSPLPR